MFFRSANLNINYETVLLSSLFTLKFLSLEKKRQQVTLNFCAAMHSVPLLHQSESVVESVFLNAHLLLGM